ncbi:MAG: heliorhodopsin HeR [Methanomassiliicoccus sp.]|nr:heliorhodopsin HeR [Methanomassiliicoccus sp.]
MVPETDPKFVALRKWNAALLVLHLVQGLAILALATSFALPVTASFLHFNSATGQLEAQISTLFTLPIAPLIALFLFTSAFDHFLLAGPFYQWYVDGLKAHINKARWFEYAFSSSIMIVVIAMLVGIYDVVSLIALFSINACMNLFGLVMEQINQNRPKVTWTPYIFGTFAGLIPWVGIAIYLAGAGQYGNVPSFVYWIFLTIAITFFSFAFNMILQYRAKGRWADYLFGEKVYMILSLVAKTLLAWQVFAGTLRPM